LFPNLRSLIPAFIRSVRRDRVAHQPHQSAVLSICFLSVLVHVEHVESDHEQVALGGGFDGVWVNGSPLAAVAALDGAKVGKVAGLAELPGRSAFAPPAAPLRPRWCLSVCPS